MKHRSTIIPIVIFSAGVLAAAMGADWLAQVPARDRQRTNPYHDQPQAIQAGRLLFEEHCAECHGQNAQGRSKRPSLRTERIQTGASEGDLHWLIINGSIRHGMPSWSRLPDQQVWQLVTYLKSLKLPE